jgi:hypothetical protein
MAATNGAVGNERPLQGTAVRGGAAAFESEAHIMDSIREGKEKAKAVMAASGVPVGPVTGREPSHGTDALPQPSSHGMNGVQNLNLLKLRSLLPKPKPSSNTSTEKCCTRLL